MKNITDLAKTLQSLGGLHDSVVCRVSWTPEAATLEFQIEDFYSNFKGLPEYPGAKSGSLIFEGVERVLFEIETDEKRLKIYDISISESPQGGFIVLMAFWPNGKITASYRSAMLPNLLQPA